RKGLICRYESWQIGIVLKCLVGIQSRAACGFGNRGGGCLRPFRVPETHLSAKFKPMLALGPAERVAELVQGCRVALLRARGHAAETVRRHATDRSGNVCDRISIPLEHQ